MVLPKDCAEYVAGFVFGCTGLAFGVAGGVAGAAAFGAPLALEKGTRLVAMAFGARQKYGVESKPVLKKIIERITDENRESIKQLQYEHGSKLSEAAALLAEHLPKCDLGREQLAKDAGSSSEAFPEAATRRVMTELAGKAPNTFGQRGNAIAISLAHEVIHTAFKTAIEDKKYFEKLEPYLLLRGLQQGGEILTELQALESRLKSFASELKAHLEGMEARIIAAVKAQMEPGADLPDPAILSLAERIVDETGGDEALALAELERAVKIARQMREAGTSLGNLDAFVAGIVQRMADLNDTGDEEGGDVEFEKALDQFRAQEAERAERAVKTETALIEQGINQAYLLRDAEKVARREEMKAALTESGEALFDTLRGVLQNYYETGSRMGTRLDLQIAVALAERCISIGASSEAKAMAQNDLGNVLWVLGKRGEAGALEQAVSAFEAALKVYTREASSDWAMTQNNLGIVLQVLGERGEAGALERAVSAYEAALKVYTREVAPSDWAMTQNNLGNVLSVLGELGEAGALERAVSAFEAALEVYTREAAPSHWAMTQNNLGAVLWVLGARGEAGALGRAVSAYEAALEVDTREAAPAQWAMTQENLAIAYVAMADVDIDPLDNLNMALEAVTGALEVYRVQGMSYYIEKAERLETEIREKLAAL